VFLNNKVLSGLIMACGGPPEGPSSSSDNSMTNELAHHLGQVSLDASPILPVKVIKPARNFSLRNLEIMATIGNNSFSDGVCNADMFSQLATSCIESLMISAFPMHKWFI